jgi:hypothetical protein
VHHETSRIRVWYGLSEQSTDEGEPCHETRLDGETQFTILSTCRGGARRGTSGSTRRSRGRGGEGGGGSGDVELLGLGEDGDTIGILLDDVDLESLAGGPAGSGAVHGGGSICGGNVRLQNDIDIGVYLHVSQHESKHGGIGGDGGPGNSLAIVVRLPDGILGRVDDGGGPGVSSEKDGCRKCREGTHCLE